VGLPLWSLASNVSEEPEVTEGRGPVKQQMYKGQKAVVVGGGPAGLVAAAYLAKHGFSVKVYEGRSDIRLSPDSGDRTYNIVLFGSAPDVLADMGVDLPSPEGGFKSGLHAFQGAFFIKPDGSLLPMPAQEKNRVMGTRNSITRGILSAIERHYSGSVDVKFNHMCKSLSFKDQKITFDTALGNEVVVDYDFLVAADGFNSVIRGELQQLDGDLKVQRAATIRSYVGVDGLKVPDQSGECYKSLKPGWITFGAPPYKPAQEYVVSFAYAMRPDGRVHAVYGGLTEMFDDKKGNWPEWIDKSLSRIVPQDWKQGIQQRIERAPASKTPTLTYVSKLNGPRTVLIGDAAHGVSPSLGFGCNMAITDSEALNDALNAANGDASLVPQKFHDLRFQTVRSYQQIEAGVGSQGAGSVGSLALWRFVCTAHMNCRRLLGQFFSNKGLMTVQQKVMEGQMGATEGLNTIKREALIASVFLIGALYVLFRNVVLPTVRNLISQFPMA